MPPPLTVKFAVVPFAGMYKIIMKWDVSVSSQFDKNETIEQIKALHCGSTNKTIGLCAKLVLCFTEIQIKRELYFMPNQ